MATENDTGPSAKLALLVKAAKLPPLLELLVDPNCSPPEHLNWSKASFE